MPSKDRIVRATPKTESKVEEKTAPQETPSGLNEVIAKARNAAKESGKVKRVQYSAKPGGTRPKNVYKENTDEGVFIWWTTEDSKTVGKEIIAETNEHTLESEERGYELTIPFTEEVANEVYKLGGRFSGFYVKDGERTSKSKTFEDFLKHSF